MSSNSSENLGQAHPSLATDLLVQLAQNLLPVASPVAQPHSDAVITESLRDINLADYKVYAFDEFWSGGEYFGVEAGWMHKMVW